MLNNTDFANALAEGEKTQRWNQILHWCQNKFYSTLGRVCLQAKKNKKKNRNDAGEAWSLSRKTERHLKTQSEYNRKYQSRTRVPPYTTGFSRRPFLAGSLSSCMNGPQQRQEESDFLPCFPEVELTVVPQNLFHWPQGCQKHPRAHKLLKCMFLTSNCETSTHRLKFRQGLDDRR